MHVDRGSLICGYPALEIRRVLRAARSRDMSDDVLVELLRVTRREAVELRDGLVAEGYWRRSATFRPAYETYTNTVAGNQVASASALRPISRATAARLVTGLVNRMIELETRSEFAFRLVEAIVFGSYAKGAEVVSDIDVGYRLEGKGDTPEASYQMRRERSRIVGQYREFRNPVEDLMWPVYEVLRFLKHRSGYISLHDLNEEEEIVKRSESFRIYPQLAERPDQLVRPR
jgi:predicted nucleotidyltransferase